MQGVGETMCEKYQKNFGQYVREHRERKGYTQQKLAEQLKVTPKSISYIEHGENYPSVDNMFELAHILDLLLQKKRKRIAVYNYLLSPHESMI